MSEAQRTITFFDQLSNRARTLLDRLEPPDSLVLVLTALVVGIGGGLGAVIFVWLLRHMSTLARWLIFDPPVIPTRGTILLWGIGILVLGIGLVELAAKSWRYD